jgi:spore maturation protein CgeB
MKILYVSMRWDYGDQARGMSFEETNFRSALEGMGHEVVAFDFMEREQEVGRARMRNELVERAGDVRPEVIFSCLYTDQVDTETVARVRAASGAPAINWFADDHWRFDDFSRHLAPAFDFAVTTDPDAILKYRAIGYDRAILSQWACNKYAYRKVSDALEHDVTFVGQPHGNRREMIERLQRAGIAVECWGHGWPRGRLGHEEMVRVFSTSRINLNLSNSSTPERPNTVRGLVGALLGRGPELVPRPSQIKGRTFEVPGCGGFELTEQVPHLGRYLEPGREVAVYQSDDDLVAQVRYWLDDEERRRRVAAAGYQRVLAEHTYDHRFAAIFSAAGLA